MGNECITKNDMKNSKHINRITKKMLENQSGITLIALVITIVILLILAGITIATLTGENGLFVRAKESKEAYIGAEMEEALIMALQDLQAEKLAEATLDDITQEWANDKLEEYKPIVGISTEPSGKTITMEKLGITRTFLIDGNFAVTNIDETIVTYTTEPEGYTNQNKVKISITVINPKGIQTIEKPNGEKIQGEGQTEIKFDYNVTANGAYTFKVIDSTNKEVIKDIVIDKIDKLAPLDFTPEVQINGKDITIISNAKDAEKNETSTKSGIDYCEYYLTDERDIYKTSKYDTNKINNLEASTYSAYVVAYDKAGNTTRSTIIKFRINSQFKKISAGLAHSSAIDSEGALWYWGYPGDPNYPIDNNRNTTYHRRKYKTEMLFKEVSSGQNHTLAIDNEGNLWGYGCNRSGQLGKDSYYIQSSPFEQIKLKQETKFKKIATGGAHSLAIDIEGNLWACGHNSYGQLGATGTPGNKGLIQIKTPVHFEEIDAGIYHSLAIDSEGNLWSWGYNSNGQLGDGTTMDKRTPVQIASGTKFKKIATGYYHNLAIDNEGNLWSWGMNSWAQLGDGTKVNKNTPVQIKPGTKFTEIAAGTNHSLAIDSEGNLWSWGQNNSGQVGDGTTKEKLEPVQIMPEIKFKDVVAGNHHSFAIDSEGITWAWGDNGHGRLGDGSHQNCLTPIQI